MIKSKKNIVEINLIPKDQWDKQPVIYIHYYKGVVQYVGQTVNIFDGRPFRASYNQPVDSIRWIKAPKNDRARLKWEAYLVCKLKPKRQNVKSYQWKSNDSGYKKDELEQIEWEKDQKRKLTRKICKKLRSALHDYDISEKGYIPLDKGEIERKRMNAFYDTMAATENIIRAEEKINKWHANWLFRYAVNKRRIIENKLYGPLKNDS